MSSQYPDEPPRHPSFMPHPENQDPRYGQPWPQQPPPQHPYPQQVRRYGRQPGEPGPNTRYPDPYPPPQPSQQMPYGQPYPGQPYSQPPPFQYQPYQPPAPAPVLAPQRRRATPRRKVRKGRLFAVLVVLGLVIWGISSLVGGGSGATWKATVENYQVTNPADLGVTVQVTNTGSKAAKPTCMVRAEDPSGAYSGFDEGTLTSPVQPGRTATYVDNVTITHQGARYVTQVTVSC